jgi:Phage-related lysozyme (muraminidase)
MNVPENAIAMARTFEGFSARPYICPAGFVTQGFGRLVKSTDAPPITEETALVWLEQDLITAMMATLRLCPTLIENEERLGAITDFTFNLGAGRLKASTLRRKINQGVWDEVPAQLMKWAYGGGRKLKGLVLRRQAEAAYF